PLSAIHVLLFISFSVIHFSLSFTCSTNISESCLFPSYVPILIGIPKLSVISDIFVIFLPLQHLFLPTFSEPYLFCIFVVSVYCSFNLLTGLTFKYSFNFSS